MVPWEITPPIRRRFPTPQTLKTPKKLTAVCNAEVEKVTTPRKRKRSEYGSYTPKTRAKMARYASISQQPQKSTFQPKNRSRIGEGVKKSLLTWWFFFYIDRV